MRGSVKRLSAVILTYRKGWFLSRFTASFLSQTRLPDDVIVVDDASDDSTIEALKRLPSHWRTIRLRENGGQSHARNVGLAAAQGNLVVFLDADIEMRPEMLELLENELTEHPEAFFSYCHYRREGALRGQQIARTWDPETLQRQNYISAISMARRMWLPHPCWDESLRKYEDWDLWLRMAQLGRPGALVDRVLFSAFYRKGDVTPGSDDREARDLVLRKNRLLREAAHEA